MDNQPVSSTCGLEVINQLANLGGRVDKNDREERENKRREQSQLHKEIEKLKLQRLFKEEEIEARDQKIVILEARVKELEAKIDSLTLDVTSLTRKLQSERQMKQKIEIIEKNKQEE